jgi:hypothetical protein
MEEYNSLQDKLMEWRPNFIHEIREHAEDVGILQATHDILARDNVTVAGHGDVDRLKGHPGGLLFVGNHDKQFEFVALMDFMSQIGRTSMQNIVKFYVESQVNWALGDVGTDIVLPVYPRLLATDRKRKVNSELGSRIIFRQALQTTEESHRRTEVSLVKAGDTLGDGGVVNIFPCGAIANNMKQPWRSGVGRIIRHIPEAERDKVLVVPYHADSINRLRLLATVAMRGRGLLGRPQQIGLEMGTARTAADIIDSTPESLQEDPMAITNVLRRQYAIDFGYSSEPGPAELDQAG